MGSDYTRYTPPERDPDPETEIPEDGLVIKQVQWAWVWSSMPWLVLAVVLGLTLFEEIFTIIFVTIIVVPRYFRWRRTEYVLTKDTLFYQQGGVAGYQRHEIPVSTLRDVRSRYGMFGRALGYQTVDVMLDNGAVASLQYVSALLDLDPLIRRLIDANPEDGEAAPVPSEQTGTTERNAGLPGAEAQHTLPEHMTTGYIDSLVENGRLGTGTVLPARFLLLKIWFYETGALLGRARRKNVVTLAQMFSGPGSERDVADDIRTDASRRLSDYGGDPPSFFEFVTATESDVGTADWLAKEGMEPRPVTEESVSDLREESQLAFLEGIGFGARFPELTETMWQGAHEFPDETAWADARAQGVDLPDVPRVTSLEEHEREALAEVASFAAEHYPDLLGPLGLDS